jgi:hypothetical protein
MSANWPHHRSEQQQQAMTDFADQKLVVVGGSSATGRDTAADPPDRTQMERVRQQLASEPSGRKGCRGAVLVGEHRQVALAAPQQGPDGTTATGLSSRPAPSACSQPPLGDRRTQIEVRS